MSEQTALVGLTLDESGHLCHLLLASILQQEQEINENDSTVFTPQVKLAMLKRSRALYKKLADANDLLMNKGFN